MCLFTGIFGGVTSWSEKGLRRVGTHELAPLKDQVFSGPKIWAWFSETDSVFNGVGVRSSCVHSRTVSFDGYALLLCIWRLCVQ